MLRQMAPQLLVVEDDDGIAAPLQRTLEREGYVVERVATGQAGLDRVEQRPAVQFAVLVLEHEPGVGQRRRPLLEEFGDREGVARVVHLDVGRNEERHVVVRVRAARVRQGDDGELFAHVSLLGEGEAVFGPQR